MIFLLEIAKLLKSFKPVSDAVTQSGALFVLWRLNTLMHRYRVRRCDFGFICPIREMVHGAALRHGLSFGIESYYPALTFDGGAA
jgi:hypothetical protein